MISLKNVTLRRAAKVLLQDASVVVQPGEKVGLVGRNGAGKSTLFALFNGTLHEDAGDFARPPHWRLSQVAQEMPETGDGATDFVLGGDAKLMALRAALVAAEHGGDGMAIAHAHSDLADAGEHDAIPRAQSLILGLGFQPTELEQPVNSFSGGWRMRLQLARALMAPSDLLLLDEPTNHLDLDALVWLEAWLRRYEGTLIVISHDREFLDAVTGVTLHIDNARLVRYAGNYSAFETTRAQQLELQQAAFSRQQDRIAHLQKFIDRFKAKASKAKQAQSRVKALERMEKIAPVLAEAEFTFEFKEPANLPNPMLAIQDGVFGYGEKAILRGVSRSVLAGQRIGILGANGQGKSTLVKTIARDIALLGGTVTEGKGLAIGYFAQQELDVLHSDDTPLQHMTRLAREKPVAGAPSREQDLRSYLGSFNFSGDMVQQAIGTMSGGEKARLVLATIVWQRPNLLLLDEPTNHLDLQTREALSVALNEFEGTVMLVSHDRALLRSVCDEFWLVGRGTVAPFDGDLDDYQRYLLEEAKRLRDRALAPQEAPAAPKKIAKKPVQERSSGRSASGGRSPSTVKRELAAAEKRMEELEKEKLELENALASATDSAAFADLGRHLNHAAHELHALEERWLELTAELDALR